MFVLTMCALLLGMTTPFQIQMAFAYTAEELLKLTTQIKNENPGIKFDIKTDKDEYKVGEDVVIRFKADKDCYVALIDVGTSGKTIILFPNKWHSDNKIEKDKTYTIPPLGSDFAYKVLPPAGEEHIKAIASVDPVLSKIASLQEELKQPIETKPEKGQVFLSMKDPGLVLKDIGIVFQKLDPSKWATKEYTLKIVDAGAVSTSPPEPPPSVTPVTKPTEGTEVFKGKDGFYEIRYDATKWQASPGPGDIAETAFNHKSGDADVLVLVQPGQVSVPMETIKQAFLEIIKGVASDVVVKEDKEIQVNNTTVTSITVNGKSEGTPYCFHGYLWKGASGVVDVVGSCPESVYPQFKDDIEKFLNGLVILKP
ncbi:MAG: DUF4384 domain-containing protein [Pseudomonadota bacterium]